MVVSFIVCQTVCRGGSKPVQPTQFASTMDLGRVCPKFPVVKTTQARRHPGPPQHLTSIVMQQVPLLDSRMTSSQKTRLVIKATLTALRSPIAQVPKTPALVVRAQSIIIASTCSNSICSSSINNNNPRFRDHAKIFPKLVAAAVAFTISIAAEIRLSCLQVRAISCPIRPDL